jgi:hypothetical protein
MVQTIKLSTTTGFMTLNRASGAIYHAKNNTILFYLKQEIPGEYVCTNFKPGSLMRLTR